MSNVISFADRLRARQMLAAFDAYMEIIAKLVRTTGLTPLEAHQHIRQQLREELLGQTDDAS